MRPRTDRILRSVTAGALGVVLVACGRGEQVEAPPVVRPVSTLVVGSGFSGRLTFPGTVQAADRAELSFRVARGTRSDRVSCWDGSIPETF